MTKTINAVQLITFALSVLAMIISLRISYRNWRYTETVMRYSIRNQYTNALFDIDRRLLDNPKLWAIYDNHPLAQQRSSDPEEVARREAFIYYHLNLFECVFQDYTGIPNPKEAEKQYWAAVMEWITVFLVNSSEAREILRSGETRRIYSKQFTKRLDEILGNI